MSVRDIDIGLQRTTFDVDVVRSGRRYAVLFLHCIEECETLAEARRLAALLQTGQARVRIGGGSRTVPDWWIVEVQNCDGWRMLRASGYGLLPRRDDDETIACNPSAGVPSQTLASPCG